MFLIDFSYPDFFTGKIYYCLEVVCAFSAGRKVVDDTRVQAFVIRVGGMSGECQGETRWLTGSVSFFGSYSCGQSGP